MPKFKSYNNQIWVNTSYWSIKTQSLNNFLLKWPFLSFCWWHRVNFLHKKNWAHDRPILIYSKTSMCIRNPPIYLTQYLLIGSKLIVTKSEKFLLLDASCLEKIHFSAVPFLGIFSDSQTVRHFTETHRRTNPKLHQRACNLCSSAEIPCGRSGFCRGQSAVAPKIVPEPSPKLVVSLV